MGGYVVREGKDGILVMEQGSGYEVDLRQRLLAFSVTVIQFLMNLPNKKEFEVFKYQLSRSATSIGANYEEAQSASLKEFVQKSRIALREANESKYWLTILKELHIGDQHILSNLIQEAQEIALIFGAIVSRTAKKLQKGKEESDHNG